MIRFSVIIPNYNHAAFLEERIESVLKQTYQYFDIILIDDCSTDNSRPIIEKYRPHERVTVVYNAEKNSGSPFGQWQKGISLAKNDWIWIAESDDVALPGFLETAANQITNDTSLWFCNSQVKASGQEDSTTADICNKNFNTNWWSNSYTLDGKEEINRSLKYRSPVLNVSAVVFNKTALAQHGLDFRPFRYFGDWYLYLHLLASGTVVYEHTIYNIYRRTGASHSQQMKPAHRLRLKEEYFRLLQVLMKSPVVTDKKAVLRWFNREYTGYGLRSDGIGFIAKLVIRYYSINFRLATRVIFGSLFSKFHKRTNDQL